ncbi:MAG: TIGR03960 family B12-binding radical SAM protein [Leptospirales bacterium]|nr:TIGR03960 family B12-binding radical SAM protein [Leptospirales bacterium]
MNNTIKNNLNKFLHHVQKPAGYLGGELNTIVKDNPLVKVAISYPDLYEVGMSNNGINILYEVGNSIKDAACERVFAVAPDFENELKSRNIPLYTLESYTPLNRLDAVGFNISHELLAANLLQILDLGGIPIQRRDRKDFDPIIIAGGEAVSNPFPYSDFVDIFFIGDGEIAFSEIIKTLIQCKTDHVVSRETILNRLKEIDGVLLSCDYDFNYIGTAADISSLKRIKKVSLSSDGCFSPAKPILPSIRISHNRAVIEVARGCSNLCKFCHAGYYNLPYRSFDYERIISDIINLIDNTGYDEVTLTALSVSDYKHIVKVLNNVLPELTERGVSIALPSLKVDRNTLPIIETVSNLRRSSLTFAVESASDEICSRAYKRIRKSDLFDITNHVFNNGWRGIKLYFMIGLPGCDETDEAEEIISLLKNLVKRGRGKRDINVTISPFIPKPHTPFEHEKQMSSDYFNKVIYAIKSASPKQVTIKNHDVRSSFLEGLFSRGDTRCGKVIYDAYKNGARLDSWREYFKFDLWMNSIEKNLPEWSIFFEARDIDKTYPWQIIEAGNEKAVNSMRDRKLNIEEYRQPDRRYSDEFDAEAYRSALKKFEQKYTVAQRLRAVFEKTGTGRYIGHIDFTEIIKRGLRMAKIPIAFSRGFSKRERISCGYPVPIGIESVSEIVDIELYSYLAAEDMAKLTERVNAALPDFIKLKSIREKEDNLTIMAMTNAIEYRVNFQDTESISAILSFLSNSETFTKSGKKGKQTYPLKEILHSYKADDEAITIVLYIGNESSVRVDEFLKTVTGEQDIYGSGINIVKLGQYKKTGEELELIR